MAIRVLVYALLTSSGTVVLLRRRSPRYPLPAMVARHPRDGEAPKGKVCPFAGFDEELG
jgi:hypothetical protein